MMSTSISKDGQNKAIKLIFSFTSSSFVSSFQQKCKGYLITTAQHWRCDFCAVARAGSKIHLAKPDMTHAKPGLLGRNGLRDNETRGERDRTASGSGGAHQQLPV
jgi:hypothetical protein